MASEKKQEEKYTVDAPLSEKKEKDKKQKRNDNWDIILAIIVAALLVVIVVGIVISAKMFGNPRARIDQAVQNTFQTYARGDNKLFTSLNVGNILKDKVYTVSVDGSTAVRAASGQALDVAIDADMAVNNDLLQVYGDVDPGLGTPIAFKTQLQEDRFSVHLPLMNKYLFTYRYREDNKDSNLDFLANQIFGMGVDIEMADVLLSTAYDVVLGQSGADMIDQIKGAVKQELAGVPAVRSRAESFTVDGANRRCNAYSMRIKHENLVSLADRIDNILQETYGDAQELDVMGSSFGDMTTQLRTFANSFQEIELTFYVYRKQLAAIKMDGGNASATLLFKGGDYRTQNMGLIYNGEEYCTVESSLEGGVENFLLVTSAGTYISYTYDTSDGKLTLEAKNGELQYEFKSVINNSGNMLVLTFGNTDVGDSYFAGTVTLKKGADLQTLEGTELDLSSKNSDDMTGFIIDLLSVFGLSQ